MRYRAWAGVSTALLLAFSPRAAAYSQTPTAAAEALTTPTSSVPVLDFASQAALQRAISGPQRIEPARDRWRNPAATLQFFGVRPTDTVIEIWPGQGWYTSILGAYLKQGSGKLIVGHWDANSSNFSAVRQIVDAYRERFEADQDTYGSVNVVPFGPWSGPLARPNSVDCVLTFRNVHNWMADSWAEKAFADFFLVLKPGGILGIEEHRGRTDEPQDPLASDGYVREDFVIQLALEAGFEFIGRSEINANPADTKDHPFGVWTLPPVSRTSPIGQPDDPGFNRTRFDAIGESDRMTLRFRKPLKPSVTMTAENPSRAPMVINPAPSPPPAVVRPSATVTSVPTAPPPIPHIVTGPKSTPVLPPVTPPLQAALSTQLPLLAVSPPPPPPAQSVTPLPTQPTIEPKPAQPGVGPPKLHTTNVAQPSSPPHAARVKAKALPAPPVASPRPKSTRQSPPAVETAGQPTPPSTSPKLRPTKSLPTAVASPPAATKAPAKRPKSTPTASAPEKKPKARPTPRQAPASPARKATRPSPPVPAPKAKTAPPPPPAKTNKPDWVVPRKSS
jgi:predicted methyltransferase